MLWAIFVVCITIDLFVMWRIIDAVMTLEKRVQSLERESRIKTEWT